MTTETETPPHLKPVEQRDVQALCHNLFNVNLYPTQEKIVEAIAFQQHQDIVINTYTRYGKTFSVAIAIALFLVLNGENLDDFRIGIVAPTEGDAANVRKEMLKNGIKSKAFSDMIDTSQGNDPEDLVKSRSKDELTFNDGDIELHTVSASSGRSGDGSGAMGEGFDFVIMDESNRISHTFWKESGDRLREHEDTVLIEMGNPRHKDNQFYMHWTSNDYKSFHVGEEKGIEEDRHSKEWFDARAKELGGRETSEYKVLYKSEFPDQVDDALIQHSWIEEAQERTFEMDEPNTFYGLDVAGEGDDKLVLTRVAHEDGKYVVTDQWAKDKSRDTSETAHWAAELIQQFDSKEGVDRIVVDYVGIGAGVHSKLKELGFDPVRFKAGNNPVAEEDRFTNKKARNFFKIRDLLQDGDIAFLTGFENTRGNSLVHELTHITVERGRKDKVKVVDPDSGSPDYADSLMMALYRGNESWVL